MVWQADREQKYLSFNEEIIISSRLNWIYAAIPLFRIAVITVMVAIAMNGVLGWWLIPVAILAIQWIRNEGFAGDLGFVAVAAIIATIWAGAEYALDPATRTVLIISIILLMLIKGAVDYAVTRLYLTDKRIILRTGIFTERRSTLPLRALTDMRYDQTLLGRVFDYGHFFVESAGQNQALSQLRFVDAPRRFYRIVMELALGGNLPPGAVPDPPP